MGDAAQRLKALTQRWSHHRPPEATEFYYELTGDSDFIWGIDNDEDGCALTALRKVSYKMFKDDHPIWLVKVIARIGVAIRWRYREA